MPLTIREKDHWRERITRKINQAIEALYADEKPTFLEDIRKKARERALTSLGIAQLDATVKRIDQQSKDLTAQRSRVYHEMLAIVKGAPPEDASIPHYCQPHEVGNAVTCRTKVHERECLQETELGRRILELEKEKEELLDTVWLATSTTQIKQLWQTATDILKQQPTELQEQALQIEAIPEGRD